MARIPEAEVARIKREVDLVEVVGRSGVKLSRRGEDLVGLCPFHDDREPSLVVSPAKNLWHCLGACATGGSVIDWVMRAEGLGFREAVESLQGRFPLPGAPVPPGRPRQALGSTALTEPVGPPDRSEAADPDGNSDPVEAPDPDDIAPELSDDELLSLYVAHCHRLLKETPEALEYLASRGLAGGELVERFRLGFAERSLTDLLPSRNTQAGAALRKRLTELGILKKTGYQHLAGCLVVPIFEGSPEEDGRVVELYGRRINPKARPRHLYLPGPHRGVWNLQALAASRRVILCEALLDALTFYRHGFRAVTSTYGTNGATDELFEAFEAYGTEEVLIAFDRDKAGEEAAGKVAERLGKLGIRPYRVRFPWQMDANDVAQTISPPAKGLQAALSGAVWMEVGPPPEAPATIDPEAAEPIDSEAAKPRGSEAEASAVSEAAPSLAASSPAASGEPPPEHALPRPDVPVDVREHEVHVTVGDRRYRVRGLERNLSYEVLKVNLLAARERAEGFHVDTLDLYQARQRTAYVKQAATELALEERVIQRDLGKVLLALEELQEARITEALEPQSKETRPALTEAEQEEALALLRDPELFERIPEEMARCGLVGERINKQVGYLAAVSRLLDRPLGVLIQSSSAAGKTTLMEGVLAFVPDEERVEYSAMTGQALYYMGETDLSHKVLAVVEEEGAERASYALKLLQSEGELTIASTGKDPQTGRLVTQEYHVEGPAAIFLTTTAVEIDPELQNRCLVLTVDEGREQTRAIHRSQRERRTLEGLINAQARRKLLKVHQNAQRLLRPVGVLNPYVRELTFPDERLRSRRDHEKYLTLIDTIALLHQKQRPIRRLERDGIEIEYVEVEPGDITRANRIAAEVVGRSLDELTPQGRRLLEHLGALVEAEAERAGIERSEVRFRRADVRAWTGWSDYQVKAHMAKLTELEYVLVHRGGRGQSYVYELLWQGEGVDGERFVLGLLDVERLDTKDGRGQQGKKAKQGGKSKQGKERPAGEKTQLRDDLEGSGGNLEGSNSDLEGSRRPHGGGKEGPRRGAKRAAKKKKEKDLEPEETESGEISRRGDTTQSLRGAASPASQPLLFTSDWAASDGGLA